MGVYKVTLSSKGQLVLPAELRRRWGLRTGAELVVVEQGDRAYLSPNSFERIYAMRGMLADKPWIWDEYLREKRRERKREDRKR